MPEFSDNDLATAPVTAIEIRAGDIVDAIRLRYGDDWGPWHGGQGGELYHLDISKISLDKVEVITGEYYPSYRNDVVRSITLFSADSKKFGPFGANDERGSLKPTSKESRVIEIPFSIDYISGRSSEFLNSIEFHLKDGKELLLASKLGDLDKALLCMRENAPVNFQDEFGMSPLLHASQNGHMQIAECLINAGSDVNARNMAGQTSLHLACKNEHFELAHLLVEGGADLKHKDYYGKTCLLLVCEKGNFDFVKQLIDKGEELRGKDKEKRTCLHLACKNGNLKLAEFLIEKGMSLDERDVYLQTCLHIAAHQGHLSLIKLLLERGANINDKNLGDQTCLHIALEAGHFETAQYLIEQGLDLNQIDYKKDTCLYIAIDKGYLKLAKSLIEKLKQHEIEMQLVEACDNQKLQVVDFILKNCNNYIDLLLKRDKFGNNVLMRTASQGEENKKMLMSFLSFVVNEKEGNTIKTNLSKLLHNENNQKQTILSILISHGQSMKMYCDIIFSLEQELHPNIKEFSKCIQSRLGPSRIAQGAIDDAEQHYKNLKAHSKKGGTSIISQILFWVSCFLRVAFVPFLLSFFDIYTDCHLIFETWETFVGSQSEVIQNCNFTLVTCAENRNNSDIIYLIKTSDNVKIFHQLIYLSVFILFPLVTYFIDWWNNKTIGFRYWLKQRKKRKDRSKQQFEMTSLVSKIRTPKTIKRSYRNVKIKSYPNVWWWWILQVFTVPFWPFVYLFRKVYVSSKYALLDGKEKQAYYSKKKNEMYCSEKAIMAEICTESSFQPLLQLYLLLPCLISHLQCETFGSLMENIQLWSVAASVSALAWSFSSYLTGKTHGALSKFSPGHFCILLYCTCFISGRMMLVTFFAYALGQFWAGVFSIGLHIFIVFCILLIQTFFIQNNSRRFLGFVSKGYNNIKQSFGNIFFNSLANIYLQMWIYDNSQNKPRIERKNGRTKKKREEVKPDETSLQMETLEKISIHSNVTSMTSYYGDLDFKNKVSTKTAPSEKINKLKNIIKGILEVQPTFWVEIMIQIENLSILITVFILLDSNKIAKFSSLVGFFLYYIGFILKIIYYRNFYIWRHVALDWKHFEEIGQNISQYKRNN